MMDSVPHHFADLFAQLGLPSDKSSIQRFIEVNGPLDASLELADAPFWTASQASFLREQIQEDADWSELVDQLSITLRNGRS
jgi:hypothetical protein